MENHLEKENLVPMEVRTGNLGAPIAAERGTVLRQPYKGFTLHAAQLLQRAEPLMTP